jgi:hypothetical protein
LAGSRTVLDPEAYGYRPDRSALDAVRPAASSGCALISAIVTLMAVRAPREPMGLGVAAA